MLLDASALLALVLDEPGAEAVDRHLHMATISAANLSEAATRLTLEIDDPDAVNRLLDEIVRSVIPVDQETAMKAAALVHKPRPFGLSLGDRLCLATALQGDLPVLTADRMWAKLDVPIAINLIR